MPGNKFVILLYHGVTRATHRGIENCSRKHLPVDEFARQMEYLAANHTVLRLSELLALSRNGGLPPRTVAVTFDDGFENNYSVAVPVLQHYGIPATFFLATGFIDTDRTFWVDKVEYLLNESPLTTLRLETLGRRYSLHSLSEKEKALWDIKRILKGTPGLVDEVIDELERISHSPTKYGYEDYRTLTWDQVRAMHKSGLCEFGAHTVDHAILSHLSRLEKEYQIFASKRMVEDKLGEEIDLFSYPEGQESHYDEETIQILQAAGFSSSSTAIFGVNTGTTSDYHLRRNMVGFTAPFRQCLEVLNAHCR